MYMYLMCVNHVHVGSKFSIWHKHMLRVVGLYLYFVVLSTNTWLYDIPENLGHRLQH